MAWPFFSTLSRYAAWNAADSRDVLLPADISLVEAAVRTILVVDDNDVNRALLLRQLGRLGHEATAVASAVQALEAVAATPYAVVLMDCRMPGMDGMEATRRIREAEAGTGQRVPIVAVTANAMEADRDACFDAGMDGFLTKPVMMESLRAVLDQFVLGTREETEPTTASSTPSAG